MRVTLYLVLLTATSFAIVNLKRKLEYGCHFYFDSVQTNFVFTFL